MRRLSFLALALTALGCRGRDEPAAIDPGPSTAPSAPPAAADPEALLPGATCSFPAKIESDLTIAEGCVVDVRTSVLVPDGRTLTIEPGAVLRFHPGTWLEIGHRGSRLVARGTRERPITFTSAVPHPKRGDWIGIVFDEAVGEGTAIEHAVVEYAGRAERGGQGAITVFRAFPAGRVALRDVTFRHNATAAIYDPHASATFQAFERNVLEDNERGVRASAAVIAAMGKGNEVGDEIDVLGGTIRGKGTFPHARAGYRVVDPISIDGDGSTPASLEIAKGTVLRFEPKTWLEIGTRGPAELVASGVTFTSARAAPAAGDWVGLVFGDKVRHARVWDSIIEYAGAEEHGGDAAVTFVGDKSWQALDVSFSLVTFRHIRQAHFSSNGDGCDKALDPKFGIVWAGYLEPCK